MANSGPLNEPAVHEALACLGNAIELAQCDLARCLPQVASIGPLNERGRALRSLLLEAIEALGPPRPTAFGSPDSRAYDVLTLRYVERLATVDMAEELSLSRRQIQRDLRRAEGLLTDLLRSWTAGAAGTLSNDRNDHEEQLVRELALYSSRPAQVNLSEALQEVLATVQPLSRARAVSLELAEGLPSSTRVLADSAFLRTLLVQAASLAVQAASSDVVCLSVQAQDGEVEVSLHFAATDEPDVRRRLQNVQSVAQSEGIACQVEGTGATVEVRFRLSLSVGATILVVEDNPGAVDLYRRYLAGTGWEMRAITDPRLCHQTVRTNRPDVVVLDIMMPHIEGWRVLRALKEDSETERTPVVVCSVVEDPALANALGASAYLGKPVSRTEFISAISRCLRSPRRPPAPRSHE